MKKAVAILMAVLFSASAGWSQESMEKKDAAMEEIVVTASKTGLSPARASAKSRCFIRLC